MSRDVLVAGETLIDFLPERAGPLTDVSGFDRRPGGAPANVAVALARLDRTPLFWTRLGSDPFGRYLEGVLDDERVRADFVERDPSAQTSLAFVTHDDSGDRAFTFYRDGTADTRMEPGRVPDETLADCSWVHAGGVTLSSGRSRAATLDLLERAASAGCIVSFDANYRPELWDDEATFRLVARDALVHANVCKATRRELARLGFDGETDRELARDALEADLDAVFCTRGDEGALAVAAGDAFDAMAGGPSWAESAEHGGYDVDVVDATGAGDAFLAGAIAAALDGRDLEGTLAFANAVAASATTAAGAMAALPGRERVEAVFEGSTSP
ncbi:carbohydrate kinase [Halovivax sp.]|uniref:carbohydrate kinase family protein n=1 Tax=Halovivax sp. TaxID=1935978 RepID=UPI0025C0F4EB|nr:carbohydrate kinase [Halovivax sp.]